MFVVSGVSYFPVDKPFHFNCLRRVDVIEEKVGIEINQNNNNNSYNKGEVFEILPIRRLKYDGYEGRECEHFLSRSRNHVVLHEWVASDDSAGSVHSLIKLYNEEPICSSAQCSQDASTLLITTLEENVYRYDVNRGAASPVELYRVPNFRGSASWNSLVSYNAGQFLYINRSLMYLLDLRAPPSQWLHTEIDPSGYSCDHIVSTARSSFEYLLYVASAHKLHCLDLRHIWRKDMLDPRVSICQWNHQCEYDPLMLRCHRPSAGNVEFIALSSQLAGDLYLCQLDGVLKDIKGVPDEIAHRASCLSYQPPTILEAFERARSCGLSLHPHLNLWARLRLSTTGLQFHAVARKRESQLHLLYSNSQGDVFAYDLQTNVGESEQRAAACSSRTNHESSRVIRKLDKYLQKHYDPTLHCTQIFQFGGK